jgi:hypothetical protein
MVGISKYSSDENYLHQKPEGLTLVNYTMLGPFTVGPFEVKKEQPRMSLWQKLKLKIKN